MLKICNRLYMVFLLSLTMVGLASCSDDDEGGSTSDLVGTWQSVRWEEYEKVDGKIVYEDSRNDDSSKMTFHADGTYDLYEYTGKQWESSESGVWKYKGGKLYLSSDGYDYDDDANVASLSSTQLVLDFLEIYTEDGEKHEWYYKEVYKKISE